MSDARIHSKYTVEPGMVDELLVKIMMLDNSAGDPAL
jgi:hypothetical protein